MKNDETPNMELVKLSEYDIPTVANGAPLLPYSWLDEGEKEI